MSPAEAADPLARAIATGWTTACPDWGDRLKAGRSIIPRPIYPDQAEAALSLFKSLRIVDAPGSPTFGEAGAQWIFDLVAAIFGSYDVETGRRLLRELLIIIPKKASKSTVSAGIMLTALALNWRKSAELLILAPTIRIADNAYAPARDMVLADPRLSKIMKVSEATRTITHLGTGAKLRVLAAESDTIGGTKASFVLIDELWLLGKRANAEQMLREATGGLASRPEGCVIKLSTQSDDAPAGVFKSDLRLFRDIRDGVIVDPKRLPVIYEHPADMVADGSAMLIENIHMVHPNLGRSVDMEFLRDEYTKAERAGPAELRGFLAKFANLELGLNLRSDRWSGADFWQDAGDPSLTLDTILARSDVVTVGIDGGGLDDLLGLSVIGRCKTTRKWLVWSHAWAHRIVYSRRKDIVSALNDFEAAGDLTVVDLPGDDVREVCEIISNIERSGLLAAQHAVGVDPAGISAIVDMLTGEEYGLDLERIVAVSQGWKLNGAVKTTERAVAGRTLVHCGQPLMAWSVGNAKIAMVGSAVTINKQNSGSAKIDPLISLFNAVSLMALNPEGRGSIDSWLASMSTARNY
jgi:phage terminase large subunit-like protein